MPSNVVTLKPRRAKPRSLGPVPAMIGSSKIIEVRGANTNILEINLNVLISEVPKDQRRALAALLNSTRWLDLTLIERGKPEGGGAAA